MSDIEYLLAWVIYLWGATLFYALYCRYTRFITVFELRQLLRLPVASVLFVPAFADPNQAYLAPAVVVSAFDLAKHDPGLGLRGVKFIVLVAACLFGLVVLESLIRRLRHR